MDIFNRAEGQFAEARDFTPDAPLYFWAEVLPEKGERAPYKIEIREDGGFSEKNFIVVKRHKVHGGLPLGGCHRLIGGIAGWFVSRKIQPAMCSVCSRIGGVQTATDEPQIDTPAAVSILCPLSGRIGQPVGFRSKGVESVCDALRGGLRRRLQVFRQRLDLIQSGDFVQFQITAQRKIANRQRESIQAFGCQYSKRF